MLTDCDSCGAIVDAEVLRTHEVAPEDALGGEISVAGPELAGSLTDLGLIDEYHIYLQPVVLGSGKPFFAGPRPPLRLVASEELGDDTLKLTYVPT